ncbi:MAG: hypothetical protein AMXMBFR66_15470 [Pseudomonadota bacterium]|nr:NapC/NirT family cytochrome c [Rubrivivax sp.]NLZ39832.1 cytochrome C [Comamonadaceae bacterium]
MRSKKAAALLGAAITLFLVVLALAGEAALSTQAFCTGCHSMSYPAQELAKSTHYGRVGADPQCKDCHVPQGIENLHLAIRAHLVDGSRDLWRELTLDYSDLARFNARRLQMAHQARLEMKRSDSLTCRRCHRNPRPVAPEGKAEHQRLAAGEATCIDCHQNLVHKAVAETDLGKSLATGTMVLKEE